jgi:hypothetical protein
MKLAFQSERFPMHKPSRCSRAELASAHHSENRAHEAFNSTCVIGVPFFEFNLAGMMIFSTKPPNEVTSLSLHVVV